MYRLHRKMTIYGHFLYNLYIFGHLSIYMYSIHFHLDTEIFCVCVEVLRPSQTAGVMSSAVSLPNHTLTGQAKSSKQLISTCAHSFARNHLDTTWA